jgi:hypothetical protein
LRGCSSHGRPPRPTCCPVAARIDQSPSRHARPAGTTAHRGGTAAPLAGPPKIRKLPDRPFARRIAHMLIGVLITFLVIILILYLVNLLPLDGRVKQIVRVIVIVIGILSLLRYLPYP